MPGRDLKIGDIPICSACGYTAESSVADACPACGRQEGDAPDVLGRDAPPVVRRRRDPCPYS
jgi:hypothetical protein